MWIISQLIRVICKFYRIKLLRKLKFWLENLFTFLAQYLANIAFPEFPRWMPYTQLSLLVKFGDLYIQNCFYDITTLRLRFEMHSSVLHLKIFEVSLSYIEVFCSEKLQFVSSLVSCIRKCVVNLLSWMLHFFVDAVGNLDLTSFIYKSFRLLK